MTSNTVELNKKFEDPIKGKTVLLNSCTREGLFDFPEMKTHVDLLYPAYTPDPETISKIQGLIDGLNVTIVFGTWCGDSKLQIPRFFKIADHLGVPAQNIRLIGVDGAKHAEHGLLDDMEITHVPTFIFHHGERELGRIIESPKTTLGNDLLVVLKK